MKIDRMTMSLGLALVYGLTMPLTAAAQIAPTIIPATTPAVPAAVSDAEIRAQTQKITARKIILVGDSTTQVGSGWGGSFCAKHVTSFIACVNLGRGGRSTFSYRAEGSWDLALAEMKTGGFAQTYVLIQFGHNDQPGKPGRSTDLATEFPANLARFVTETREAGATPVLVTPLARRTFKNGSLQDDLEPWAASVRDVASAMNVPLIDLHATSVAAVQAMGARAAIDLAETPPPADVLAAAETGTTISAPKSTVPADTPPDATEVEDVPRAHPTVVFDYTHLGPAGADLFAAQVAAGLARAVPDLDGELVP